ncbi:MAG: dihydrodipicolinate reductase [Spirochaeta sp.]|nr:dihydrodipicolinate reductase [Spirochaeta sp.]RPG04108.1 MAG: dihydrodipicolinate reductase [Proteobacteria bacterium TMED72]
MAYRIIVWGTGFVGSAVLRNLVAHPHFEIAAVLVNSAEKEGLDLGEILGIPETGIRATRDIEEALAVDADAVAYFGPNAMHAEANMQNLTAALRSGNNVVDTSMGGFQNPVRVDPTLRERIEEACREGASSFFSGGIDPGFGNDLFPLTLLGLCGRVDRVHTTEFIDAGTYPDQESLMGLGLARPTSDPALLDNAGLMTSIWGGPLYMMAEALGVEIESTVENYRRWASPEAIDFPLGRLEPGDCAAHQIELQGIVNGKPRIIVDHIHRVYEEAAPEWPRPQLHVAHANRIAIKGSPNVEQETVFADEHTGDGNLGGCLATGMRVVNAIPAVCAAEPGIVSTLDLPLLAGRGGMH